MICSPKQHQRRAPASTTKILTAIVALKKEPEDVVTVSRRAARTGGSALWLKAGDRLILKELLEGLMLCSGNDAGVAVAEHIAGSERNFARMMNRKAKEIGALNSNFQNPHGLRAPAHYTTAYIWPALPVMLCVIWFRQVAREEAIQWYKGKRQERSGIPTGPLVFAGADGVKTGTTAEAGYCLVAGYPGRPPLISVVLNSPDRGESARLLSSLIISL